MFTILSLLLAALCLMPSFAKLSAQPAMVASADHFGIEWPRTASSASPSSRPPSG